MITGRRGQALGALGMLPEISGLAGGLPQIEAAMRYGGLPRLIEQAELSAQFEEFKRTTPELSPIIDVALNILGTQTQAAFFDPGKASLFEQLVPSIGKAIGSQLGANI